MSNHTNWSGCLSLNAGDALTPWFISKCCDTPPVYIEDPKGDCPHYLCSGSMLNHAGPKSEVWGAGLAAWTNAVDNNATIRAVRGPLSALCAKSNGCSVPDVYGDPGLCVPKVRGRNVEKRVQIGIAAHYNDYFRLTEIWKSTWERPDNVKIINMLDPVDKVLDDIGSCDRIISSSLHGLVFAQALRVPFRWADFGGNIGGNGLKYWDFLMSVGLAGFDKKPMPLDLTGDALGDRRSLESQGFELGECDIDKLWAACPFRG